MARSSLELKIFEALESYTNNDSFCSKASFVQNFLERDLDLNNTQQSIQIEDILEEEGEEGSSSSDESSEESVSHISILSNDDNDNDEGLNTQREGDGDGEGNSNKLSGKGREALLALLLKSREQEQREEEEIEERDEDGGEVEEEEEEEEEAAGAPDDSIAAPDGIENWTQYFKLLELKRSLEEKQVQLQKEKESFDKVKSAEENRMKAEKKRVETQRKSLQSLIADYHKIKFSREEYEEKIKQLGDQLKETKLQMNKRISRWTDQQKRLEERVKTLEKENEELKKSQPRSIPARLAALKRPPMRCVTNNKKQSGQHQQQQQPARRVQFADDCNHDQDVGRQEDTKENGNLKTTLDSSSSSHTNSGEDSSASVTDSSRGDKDGQGAKEIHLSDDEADKTMPSDYVEIKHPCGTITRVTKDNKLTRHVLINKDVMDEFEDCSVRYYYHELGFSQTTYPNGDEIIEYDSGEIETKRADGSKIYTYSDGIVKMVDGNTGSEEVVFGDGSVVKKTADGECTITWPSGQKEVRTASYVKRIYTNGTVKIMYQDGSEETCYFNGRVRRKDKNGVLVDDTKKVKSK